MCVQTLFTPTTTGREMDMQKEAIKVESLEKAVEAMLDAIRHGDLDGDIELPDGSHISINPHDLRVTANLSSYYMIDIINRTNQGDIAATLERGIPVVIWNGERWLICTRFFPK